MPANVAVFRPILTRNVCNTVDEVLLLHIDRKGVWKRVAVSTEWGVPKRVSVAIEHVGRRVSRLVAICGSGPLCRSNGRSHNGLGGSSFRNRVNGHTVECFNTLGAQLTVVDCGSLYVLCVRYSVGNDLLCGYGIGEIRREGHERQQAQHVRVHDVAVCLKLINKPGSRRAHVTIVVVVKRMRMFQYRGKHTGRIFSESEVN